MRLPPTGNRAFWPHLTATRTARKVRLPNCGNGGGRRSVHRRKGVAPMDRKQPEEPEQTQASLAPETHNSEQDDHLAQAQEVAEEAGYQDAEASPLDSTKADEPGEVLDDASQD